MNETITNETIAPAPAAPAGPAAKLGCWMTPERRRTMLLRATLVQVGGAILGAAAANLALAAYQGPESVGTAAERAAYVAYSTCLRDMAAERVRWEAAGGGAWTDPASCAQPVVAVADGRRAYSVTWADYTAVGR